MLYFSLFFFKSIWAINIQGYPNLEPSSSENQHTDITFLRLFTALDFYFIYVAYNFKRTIDYIEW